MSLGLPLMKIEEVAEALDCERWELDDILRLDLAPKYLMGFGSNVRVEPKWLPEWKAALRAIRRKRGQVASRPHPDTPAHGFVYFVQDASGKGPIKIGTAIDVEKRLKGLQAQAPFKLKLLAVAPGGRKAEREYHFKFQIWRLHGEWFDEHATGLKQIIRTVRKEHGAVRKNRVPKKLLQNNQVASDKSRTETEACEAA